MTPDEMQAEIDQLRRQILIFVDMAATWVKVGHENERLQDAIDRVRALCDKPHQFVIAWEVLRAIDGEGA